MFKQAIEQLEVRRLLTRIVTTPPAGPGAGVTVRYTLKGDANLDSFVNFADLLVLSENYGTRTGAIWSNADFDYDGSVNAFDLLALASNYGAHTDGDTINLVGEDLIFQSYQEAFANDWSLAQNAIGGVGPGPANTSAGMAGNRLIIQLGASATVVLRSTTSRSGVFRVFDGGTVPLAEVKISKVQEVNIFDGVVSHSIALADSFPAASIVLGQGDDYLVANSQPNTIFGGNGNDTIFAGGGDDLVYGGVGSDRLFGEGGTDYLDGGAGKDYLDGSAGRNRLVGGSGVDKFTVRSKYDKLLDLEDTDRVNVLS